MSMPLDFSKTTRIVNLNQLVNLQASAPTTTVHHQALTPAEVLLLQQQYDAYISSPSYKKEIK